MLADGPRVRAAILCDFAQVRDGLLFVSSGGVSRVARPAYPTEMGLTLAVMLEAAPTQVAEPFEFRVTVHDEDGALVAEMRAGLLMGGPPSELAPGEMMMTPFVFDLRQVPIPHPGRFEVRLEVDSFGIYERLSFTAVQPAGPARSQPPGRA